MIKKILLMVLYSSSVFATTHYVDLSSPSPTPPYSSWVTAATNIQDAVDVAVSNDTVLVVDGYYYLSSEILITNSITVQSVNGPDVTVVDGGGSANCFNLGDSASEISGLTIINGASGVLALYATGSIVTNCIVTGNNIIGIKYCTVNNCTISWNESAQEGGGMYHCTAYNCTINGNSSRNGGGMCGGTAYNCTISGNYSGDNGGGMYGGTAYNCIIENNISFGSEGGGASQSILYTCSVIGNSAYVGGGIKNGSAYNCTFVDNLAEYRGDTCNYDAAIYNSIIAYVDVSPSDPMYIFTETTSPSSGYSKPVYFSCSPYLDHGIYGCITNSPRFMDSAAGNYRLAPDSPCIDLGVNLFTYADTDLDGLPRIVNGAVDLE